MSHSSSNFSTSGAAGRFAKLRLKIIRVLCQDSLIHRFTKFNDAVRPLSQSPAGMFFYNQRLIFFLSSASFLAVMSAWFAFDERNEVRTLTTLWFFWLIGVGYTLCLHSRFRRRLRRLWVNETVSRLPSLFGEYFLLDFFVVFLMVWMGRLQHLNLYSFAFLLVANTIVYSAYVGGGRGFSLLVPGILYLLLILTFLGIPVPNVTAMLQASRWFDILLYVGPVSSMLMVTIISVTLVSWIRGVENLTTQRELELLGNYENLLAGGETRRPHDKDPDDPERWSEIQFRALVRNLFEDLCSHSRLFWYNSACMWLLKEHQVRGHLFVLGPFVNFPEAEEVAAGVNASQGFLSTNEVLIINSMKHRRGKLAEFSPRFRASIDAPAAFVPLKRHGKKIGVLSLYGKEGGTLPQRQDRAFLRSLGSIVSNTLEQWEGRFRIFPQRDMNDLFKCQSLSEVFERVVAILQTYLLAGACEVIFRGNEEDLDMMVVAASGFERDRLGIGYVAGRGNTGECADRGETIRLDEITDPTQQGFDAEYFRCLEDTYGKKVRSWLAVPIGGKRDNHGVIKVINRISPWGWFTNEDQELAEDLAFRLHVIIKNFQHIQQTEIAKTDAQEQAEIAHRNAAEASAAQKRAEEAARQRQIDLMTMTHQLQGPLNPVVGTLSVLSGMSLPADVREELEYARALAETCLSLCWGTSATFANHAGQKVSLAPDQIDAPEEMRKLCRSLQLSNTDNDLEFRYRRDDLFPKLRINRSVFTSVLSSLIHNAMKYADKHSTVFLECTFERDTGEAALKVKSIGVPIFPEETEEIFKQFKRGKALAKTSLKYNGTGLGLWVARDLMLSVGGELTVEISRQHPRLSVFIVHLPGGHRSATGSLLTPSNIRKN